MTWRQLAAAIGTMPESELDRPVVYLEPYDKDPSVAEDISLQRCREDFSVETGDGEPPHDFAQGDFYLQ
jgi:hypothetical protein